MKQSKGIVLVIDDEESIRLTFQKFLTAENYTVLLAHDYHSALAHFKNADVDLVFLDIVLGKDNGIELLKEIVQQQSDVPVVMITGNPRIETASEAVRYHAYDYLTKPVRKTDLLNITRKGINYYRLLRVKKLIEQENAQSLGDGFSKYPGRHLNLRQVVAHYNCESESKTIFGYQRPSEYAAYK